MSEITGKSVAHEAYAFCCMRCGHGWEQAYDIEHHVDSSGRNFVVYKADGLRVPSPLSSPSCANCSGKVVRIMREGQVSSVRAMSMTAYAPSRKERAGVAAEPLGSGTAGAGPLAAGVASAESMPGASRAGAQRTHHWHLFDLLHAFQHRK